MMIMIEAATTLSLTDSLTIASGPTKPSRWLLLVDGHYISSWSSCAYQTQSFSLPCLLRGTLCSLTGFRVSQLLDHWQLWFLSWTRSCRALPTTPAAINLAALRRFGKGFFPSRSLAWQTVIGRLQSVGVATLVHPADGGLEFHLLSFSRLSLSLNWLFDASHNFDGQFLLTRAPPGVAQPP
jgi:hypothetical protein